MHHYQKTQLEEWIEQWYIGLHINTPSQLNINQMAAMLHVNVQFHDMSSQALEYRGKCFINIDSRLSSAEQWEDFLHELCHYARHCGRQSEMPDLFMEAQEIEARHFQLYAAMPWFMVQKKQLPTNDRQFIQFLKEEFGVTFQLASERAEQIKRRLTVGEFRFHMQKELKSPEKPFDITKWSEETKRLLNQLQRQIHAKGV